MKKIIAVLMVMAAMTGCGRIATGEVGVRHNFNKSVDMQVVPEGWYGSVFTSVEKREVKQTAIEISDMKPKAKDNLTLADFDITVMYTINGAKVPAMEVKYAGSNAVDKETGKVYPMYNLIERMAKGTAFDVIGNKYESLTIHTKRTELEQDIAVSLQRDLDASDKDVVHIDKVIVRSVVTDPALEESIQRSVRVEKQIEAKKQEIELAKAESERQKEEALGQAAANRIISESLDARLVEMKRIEVMGAFAGAGTHTIVMPSDSRTTLTVPTK